MRTHTYTLTHNLLVACWLCLSQPRHWTIKHGCCQRPGQSCTSVCPTNTDPIWMEMLDQGPPPLESLERFGRRADVWQCVFMYYRAACILSDNEDDPLWSSRGPREINTGDGRVPWERSVSGEQSRLWWSYLPFLCVWGCASSPWALDAKPQRNKEYLLI